MRTATTFLSELRDFVKAVRSLLSSRERWSELFRRLVERLSDRRASLPNETPIDTTRAVVETEQPPSEIEEETPIQRLRKNTERYLTARGLQIVEFQDVETDNKVLRARRHLARFMVQHCELVLPIVQRLRPTLQRRGKISWAIRQSDPEAISVLTNVASGLAQLYVLDFCQYCSESRMLEMRIRNQPFAHNFLSGQWFEWGVTEQVRRWLQQQNYPYLLYQNLKLRCQGGASLEVDLFLVVWVRGEPRFLMLECKSGVALTNEEMEQVARANRLLRLNWNRSAVITPEPMATPFVQAWQQRTNTSFVPLSELESFLCESLS